MDECDGINENSSIENSTLCAIQEVRNVTEVANICTGYHSMPSKVYKKRNNVWNYFRESDPKGKSICNIEGCGKELAGTFTTNLTNHLKRYHMKEYSKLKEQSDSKPVVYKRVDKYGPQSTEQQEFNRALALWVGSTSTVPVNIVEQNGFKEFINVVNPKLTVPCRATVQQNIQTIYSEMKATVEQKLQRARRISISADIWSKRGLTSSYLGVLATFFDPLTNEKEIILLSVKQFETISHKASDVLREMEAIIKTYGIDVSKIWFCTTDSGSNLVCAFRDSTGFDLDYPLLSKIALDLLCLPLNTAPLERSFSIGAVATLGPRKGLEGERLSQKVQLNRNKKLLYEEI